MRTRSVSPGTLPKIAARHAASNHRRPGASRIAHPGATLATGHRGGTLTTVRPVEISTITRRVGTSRNDRRAGITTAVRPAAITMTGVPAATTTTALRGGTSMTGVRVATTTTALRGAITTIVLRAAITTIALRAVSTGTTVRAATTTSVHPAAVTTNGVTIVRLSAVIVSMTKDPAASAAATAIATRVRVRMRTGRTDAGASGRRRRGSDRIIANGRTHVSLIPGSNTVRATGFVRVRSGGTIVGLRTTAGFGIAETLGPGAIRRYRPGGIAGKVRAPVRPPEVRRSDAFSRHRRRSSARWISTSPSDSTSTSPARRSTRAVKRTNS